MQPIAASEISRRFLQTHPLMPLSRRALYERKPIVLNSLVENNEATNEADWELDWPAILYAPIAEIGKRPIGLLIVGCRSDHWYTDEDIAHAHTLGISLAPMVAALRGPLARCNESETAVAHLLSHGFSIEEIARAMNVNAQQARTLVDSVTRKLKSVTEKDLTFPAIQMKRMTW